MAETPEGQAKLEKLETRLTRALAEHVEREDQHRPDPAVQGDEADLPEVPPDFLVQPAELPPIEEEEEIPPDAWLEGETKELEEPMQIWAQAKTIPWTWDTSGSWTK